jgi:hypothetical protein
MHHQRPGHQPVLRPLMLVAALLAVLGLLTMHTIVLTGAAASSTVSEPGHSTHEHSHPDPLDGPHTHPAAALDVHLSPGNGPGSTGQPCSSCPGCDHETASVCALTPAKAGSSNLLLSVHDLAPAPHQLTSWPTAGNNPPQADPVPPSLIDLSISRT